MTTEINRRTVAATPVGKWVTDTRVRGFIVVRWPSGRAGYYFRYSAPCGRVRIMPLGLTTEISPGAARALAAKLKCQVLAGADPAGDRKRRRAAGCACRVEPEVRP